MHNGETASAAIVAALVCFSLRSDSHIREIFTDLGGFRPQPAGPVFQRATMCIKPRQVRVDWQMKFPVSPVKQKLDCARGHTVAANNP
jgi:hypothetical protein